MDRATRKAIRSQPKNSVYGAALEHGDTDIENAHRAACDAQASTYIDPKSGYTVFTAYSHLQRGFCCGCACRHCPFLHANVADPSLRKNGITETTLYKHRSDQAGLLRVLFWSGGKDGFLALRAMQAAARNSSSSSSSSSAAQILLLTTCDGVSGSVAFQNTSITDVIAQAQALQLDLLAVPLVGGEAATALGPYVHTVLAALEPFGARIVDLCFGDLHLEDIRSWREQTFSSKYPCRFPVFGVSYADLLARLRKEQSSGAVSIAVSAVRSDISGTLKAAQGTSDSSSGSNGATAAAKLAVGVPFDEAFLAALPHDVDQMGENGEFHTHVTILRGP